MYAQYQVQGNSQLNSEQPVEENVNDIPLQQNKSKNDIKKELFIPKFGALIIIGAAIENQNMYRFGLRRFVVIPLINDCGFTFFS